MRDCRLLRDTVEVLQYTQHNSYSTGRCKLERAVGFGAGLQQQIFCSTVQYVMIRTSTVFSICIEIQYVLYLDFQWENDFSFDSDTMIL